MKAYCVSNDEFSIIIFHTSSIKAKLLARSGVTFEDSEHIELTAKRVKDADKYKTPKPSVLSFCKNAVIYHELDWYCNMANECISEDCALWGARKGELL